MSWLDALKQSLHLFSTQVKPGGPFSAPASHKPNPKALHFTRNALAKMSQWHLSEADIKDVFYHGGTIVKPNMMVKK
jgi:hypothetical protein